MECAVKTLCKFTTGLALVALLSAATVSTAAAQEAVDTTTTNSMMTTGGAVTTTTTTATTTTTRREPLKIQVEHQEYLPAVEQGLQPGRRFDASAFAQSSDVWIRIPAWFAGEWQSKSATQLSSVSLPSGGEQLTHPVEKERMKTDGHGAQMDNQGGIWHRIKVPFSSTRTVDGVTRFQYIRKQDFTEADAQRVVIHYLGVQAQINGNTGETVDSVQVETWQTYKPVGKDKLECTASLKQFDAAGRPTNLAKERWTEKRVAPFTRIDEKHGEDLVGSFRAFLARTSQANLIPQ